jgi:hypothetical protein
MRFLIVASKGPIIIALLAAVVVTYCRPSSDANQSHGRTDSSGVTGQASTTIVSSPSTSADPQTPSAAANGSAAAGDGDTPDALVTSPWVDTKRVMDNSTNAPGLQCAPRIFSRRDTLTLRMEHPHGEYLVVTQPDSTAFYLVYPQPDVSSAFCSCPATFSQSCQKFASGRTYGPSPRLSVGTRLSPCFRSRANTL